MIYIKIKKNDNIKIILKKYKLKIDKFNLIYLKKKKNYFLKKSIKNRIKINKAKYLLKKKEKIN
ncbi:MAG: 30S ribosomal protein S21 [Candidatus Shikimatogenerans sp. Ttur]|uniref:30S ribosomal protein S21 n=1 Tax=Candidatus Shikimatogenerans sp. Ttur TaxID=3158569 RepID=A0AAU7ZXP2_9FLAO